MLRDKIRFLSLTQRILNILLLLGSFFFFLEKNPLKMQNRPISPSISKSDVILLDLGRDFTFRGLFLALLLPSLDLDALGVSTDSN